MLTRKLNKVVISYNQVKYKVRIVGGPCVPGTPESAQSQSYILRDLFENPLLLDCGPKKWEKLTIHHNGTAWQVDAEATVEENTEGL